MDQESLQQVHASIQAAKAAINVAGKTSFLQRTLQRLRNLRSNKQSDYQEEALNAFRERALDTVAAADLTVAEAIQILGPGFILADLGKVNPTWQQHWTDGATRVSIDDDERRTWWARLLAGEIQQPGRLTRCVRWR